MELVKPDFAGAWYPLSDHECLQRFEEYDQAAVQRKGSGPLRGGLVPHAGWEFSGRLAYNVFQQVQRSVDPVDTLVLFGGHMSPRTPPTIMVRGEYWTPLGNLPVDHELVERVLEGFELVRETPDRHRRDNTIELQLPIIRHLFSESRILVIQPPAAPVAMELADAVARHASDLGRKIVVFGSTDLTHYGPNYDFAPRGRHRMAMDWVRNENDRRFIDVACALDPAGSIEEALGRYNACCPGAAAAAIECGLQLGATGGELLDYATSADVRPGDNFVGYAGIVF
jgi:AmmeMemoRadiSam system protein B